MRRILTALCIIATTAFATMAMASTTTIDRSKITIPGETNVTTTTLTTSVFKDDTEALTLKDGVFSLAPILTFGKEDTAIAKVKETGTAIIATAPATGTSFTGMTTLSKGSTSAVAGTVFAGTTISATAPGVLIATDIVVGAQSKRTTSKIAAG